MRSGGQTTVIQRVLERRAQQPPTIEDDTSSTIAVMLRCLPPPRALLAVGDLALSDQIQSRITPDVLDLEIADDDRAAIELFKAEFRPVILTDSLELIRRLRSQQAERAPFVLYISELDEGSEREAGLIAGADDCVGRRSPETELRARVGAARRIAELEAVLRIALIENRKLSTTDDLTRVASRRFFRKHFPREVERAARYGRSLSLILCDIDFFKAVNDTLGHAGGDQVLAQFGARLQQFLRRGVDWVARIGGEEFAIVLPETGYEPALETARKLRAGIANQPFAVDGKQSAITASFGLCGLDRVPVSGRKIPEHMLKVADAALYKSKHAGRNRVTATILQETPPGTSKTKSAPLAKSRAD
jgi:two-component system cell cycle response regulator